MSNLIEIVNDFNSLGKSLAVNGLLGQNDCIGFQNQPMMNFTNDPILINYKEKINKSLEFMKSKSSGFLTIVLPRIINSITGFQNFFAVFNAVNSSMSKDATIQQWVDSISLLESSVSKYHKGSKKFIRLVNSYYTMISENTSKFVMLVNNFNSAISGDTGVLAALNEKVESIDSKIYTTIVGISIAALSIIGGSLLIVYGAGSVITGNIGSGVDSIIAGVLFVAGGDATLFSIDTKIQKLVAQKYKVIMREDIIKAEVKMALGISSNIRNLTKNMGDLLKTASLIENEWYYLITTLTDMKANLIGGVTTVEKVRAVFKATVKPVGKLINDSNLIRRKMAGVHVIGLKKGSKLKNEVSKLIGSSIA